MTRERTTIRRNRALVGAGALAVVIAGAGIAIKSSEDSEHRPDTHSGKQADTRWMHSTNPVDPTGLNWALNGIVHLADGKTLSVGEPMMSYVVAGDGVYFTPAESHDTTFEHAPFTTGPLRFSDGHGPAVDTGITVYSESIGTSPNGQYLGFLDATSGPHDNYGLAQATAVVIDLTTGTCVLDTTQGMGDPDTDDFDVEYNEGFLRVRFPDNHSVYVQGDASIHYSLPEGEVLATNPDDEPWRDPATETSPDKRWMIARLSNEEVLLPIQGDPSLRQYGKPVRPQTGTAQWEFAWWIDAKRVLTIALPDDGAASSLMICRVPDGACQPIPGSQGNRVGFPVDESA